MNHWKSGFYSLVTVMLFSNITNALVCQDCAEPCTHPGVCVTDAGKCFIRRDVNNMVYRGCADKGRFRDLNLETDPCSLQNYLGWNNTKTLWCFCNTNLCNREPIASFPGGANLLFAFLKNNSEIFMRIVRNRTESRGSITRDSARDLAIQSANSERNDFLQNAYKEDDATGWSNRIEEKKGIAAQGFEIHLSENEHNATVKYNVDSAERFKDGSSEMNTYVRDPEKRKENSMYSYSKMLRGDEQIQNRIRVKYHEMPISKETDVLDANRMNNSNISESTSPETPDGIVNHNETTNVTSSLVDSQENVIKGKMTELSHIEINNTTINYEQSTSLLDNITNNTTESRRSTNIEYNVSLTKDSDKTHRETSSISNHIINEDDTTDGFALEIRSCGRVVYVGKRCPPMYAFIERLNKCYFVSREVRNFLESARFCENSTRSGDLVTIDDYEEMECLAEWVDSLPMLLDGWQGWWTAAQFNETLREFAWQKTGNVISRQDSRWRPSLVVYPYEKTCVWLVPLSKYSLGNYWCAEESGFICEAPPLDD